MDNRKAEIVIVLDRSGSMAEVLHDTIGGFNTFIEGQKKVAAEANVTLVQFDDVYEPLYLGKPIGEVAKLDTQTYVPRGSTALFDAICRTIDETGKRLEGMLPDGRPGIVIFVIQTDGYENASKKFTIHDVNERITRQRDVYSWQFVYLGANQDAMAEAGKMGINRGAAMSYGASPKGTAAAYAALNTNIAGARSAMAAGKGVLIAAQNLAWKPEDRKKQDDEIKKLTTGS